MQDTGTQGGFICKQGLALMSEISVDIMSGYCPPVSASPHVQQRLELQTKVPIDYAKFYNRALTVNRCEIGTLMPVWLA